MNTFTVTLAKVRQETADILAKPMHRPVRWVCHGMIFAGALWLWLGDWKFRRRIRRAVRAADREMARKYPEWHHPIL